MEDDQNRIGQNRIGQKWKQTIMEDYHNGRRPKWKTTKMEDDQNRRCQKFSKLNLSLTYQSILVVQ